jgi:alkylhydroperoxidase family enzyme
MIEDLAPAEERRRLPRLSSADLEGEAERVLQKLEANSVDLDVVRTVANSPHALRPFLLFSDAMLRRSAFPARVRELVILALAVERQCGYEWAEHVWMSRDAGVTDAERDLLAAAGLDVEPAALGADEDRLALLLAREIVRDESISDETWESACRTWTPAGTLDLVIVIGWWGGTVPTILKAVELPLPRKDRDD